MKFNELGLGLNMEPLASPPCDTHWETHQARPPFLYMVFHYVKKRAA